MIGLDSVVQHDGDACASIWGTSPPWSRSITTVSAVVFPHANRRGNAYIEAMTTPVSLAEVAALVGDPARANMLCALLDGRALTAGELAYAASVSPQTTSGHLA